MSPKLLTVREAAETLRLCPKTIYGRIAAGDIHALRLGDGPSARLRIPADELERFLGSWDPAIAAQLAELKDQLQKAAS